MPQPYAQTPNSIYIPGYGWMSWNTYYQTFGGGMEPAPLPSPPPAPQGPGGVYGPGGPMQPMPSPTQAPTIDYVNPGGADTGVSVPTANLYPPGYEPSSPIDAQPIGIQPPELIYPPEGSGVPGEPPYNTMPEFTFPDSGSPPIYSPPYMGANIPSWSPEGNLWTSGPTGMTGPAPPAGGNIADWNYAPAPGGGFYIYDNNWNYVGQDYQGTPPPAVGEPPQTVAVNPNLYYGDYGMPSGSGWQTPGDIPAPEGITDLVPPPDLPSIPPTPQGPLPGGPTPPPAQPQPINLPNVPTSLLSSRPPGYGGGGWYNPAYLAEIGYQPGQGTGSMWPGVAPGGPGGFGVGGEGGSFFGGTWGGALPGTPGVFGLPGGGPSPFTAGTERAFQLAAQYGYPDYFAGIAGGDIGEAGAGRHEGSFRAGTTIR